MNSLDEILDAITATINSNEDSPMTSDDFQQVSLRLSWKRQYLEILNSNSRDEPPGIQQIVLMNGDADKDLLVKDFIDELKKIAVINLRLSISLIDVDTSKDLFSTQSCVTLKNKVMDLQRKKINDLFQVKCIHEGYVVEIYFYNQESGSNMLFTSGYMNPEASGELFFEICSLNALMENVGFIGVISGDDRMKVKRCITMTKKAVQRRVKSFKNGAKSVANIDAMTTEEVCEKFFPDHTEKKPKRDPVEEENKKSWLSRLRKPKTDLVDLTGAEEEEKTEEKRSASVSSSLFFETCCSDMLEGSNSAMTDDEGEEEVPKKLIHPPFSLEHFTEHFLNYVDDDVISDVEEYPEETRSLYEMNEQFAKKIGELYQKQEDEDNFQDKRWREENKTKPPPFTRRTSRDDSNVTRRSNSSAKESSFGKSQQPSVLDHLRVEVKDVSSTSSRNENIRGSSSPKLGRGIDPKKDFIDLPGKRSRLLDSIDYENISKRKTELPVPKFRQSHLSFSSSQATPQLSFSESQAIPQLPSPNFKIPMKGSRSPVRPPSQSVISKSPNTAVKGRPPINSRSSPYSDNGNRGSMMLALAKKQLEKNLVGERSPSRYSPKQIAEPLKGSHTPSSVESFITDRKDEDIINLAEGSESDEENKKQTGKNMKRLLDISGPTTNRIFKTKQPKRNNKPNFGKFDGSSH